MTTPCAPAETAEEGSLHWVQADDETFVAQWRQGQWWDWLSRKSVGTDVVWRYVGPASHDNAEKANFQARVRPWLIACFGEEIAGDKIERNHRFLEEALETVQAGSCTRSEAHQIVDYVFGRPVGELEQEVGGTLVTLAALCLAHGLNMHECAEVELARVWTKVEKIRAKQAAKPKHSPLPEHTASPDDAAALTQAQADELLMRLRSRALYPTISVVDGVSAAEDWSSAAEALGEARAEIERLNKARVYFHELSQN